MTPTVVRDPVGVRVLVWLGFPLVGAGAGWLLVSIAGWVAALEWAPWQGPFRLVDSIDQPWKALAGLGLGLVAGLVLSFLAWKDSLVVTVSGGSVGLKRGDAEREIAASGVRSVFADGKELVLLGASAEELAREKSDLEPAALEEAFRAHGFVWLPDGDPHRAEFRRWVEGDPALPGSANAVLKAREQALRKDHKDDAAELRAELAKLGVVVRDERKRQWWRPAADGFQG